MHIETSGWYFDKAAVKVPKQQGVDELRGEVESLHRLSHVNVVQILGMMHGKTPDSGDGEHWAMALEWCDSDLTKLLYESQTADPSGAYTTMAQMCELIEDIANGLVYIHEQQKPHLDLKPDNVLLAKGVGGRYVAKLADFGMAYVDETVQFDGESQTTGKSTAPKAPQTADLDKIVPFGTWEYLSPECWKRKYGEPSFTGRVSALPTMLRYSLLVLTCILTLASTNIACAHLSTAA